MSVKTSVRAKLELARTYRVPHSFTDEVIYNFFEGVRCPRSLTCWLLYKHKEYKQLVELETNPYDYAESSAFRDAYTATSFLSKASFLPLEESKQEVAFKKFFVYEELCKETNRRFRSPGSDPLFAGPSVWLLNATKRKIEQILDGFSPEEFVDQSYWGPGVSTTMSGCDVSVVNKFQQAAGITHDLLDLVRPWFATAYPSWAQHLHNNGGFKLQKGNKITTVPKNSKTDRVIAIEPDLNLWFQKGLGAMIRRRLRRVGVNLNSQERNQQLAKLGSETNHLATVDFSSASDSIASAVVEELLPRRWFLVLEACRSKIGIHNNSVVKWEKFSSMGNGFTFELESLIFYAAALAVAEYTGNPVSEISVFGDDVILPSACYDAFVEFSTFLGFKVNRLKSFSSTNFRESCGAHYFNGSDCKPIYLKDKISNVQTVYKLANSVRLLAHRRNSYHGCDRRLRRCWSHLHFGIPKLLRFGTSVGYGDSGFFVNFDEATPSLARQNPKYLGYEGFLVESLIEVAITRPFDETGLLLARVSRGSEFAYGNTCTLRGRTRKRITRILVHQWYDMGAWS